MAPLTPTRPETVTRDRSMAVLEYAVSIVAGVAAVLLFLAR